jgi:signal transduction histidine kinase
MIGRGQSLLTLALVLLVPIAGLLLLERLRDVLLDLQPQAQLATTQHLAEQLASSALPPVADDNVRVRVPPHKLSNDGFADDWREWHDAPLSMDAPIGELRLAADRLYLHGLFTLARRPQQWRLWPDSEKTSSLSVAFPANTRPQFDNQSNLAQRTQLQTGLSEGKWTLEWRIPAHLFGQRIAWQFDDGQRHTARLLSPSAALLQSLSKLPANGERVWLADRDGTLLAHQGDVVSAPRSWWLDALAQAWLLSEPAFKWQGFPQPLPDQAAVHWIEREGELRLLTRQAVDAEDGWQLYLEASSKLHQTIDATALAAMVIMALVGFVLAPAGLILSASRTRRRIMALRQASAQAQHNADQRLPVSAAGDALDGLAKQFNRLLEKQHEQRDYLEQLGARLAHEMRTPITAARSSLQRIGAVDSNDAQQLVDRADSHLSRLARLLQAMSESRRLEDSLAQADWERVDLNQLALHLMKSHADTDPQRRYRAVVGQSALNAYCAPDLLVLAVEKMLGNAREFTPDGGRIQLRVQPQGDWLELRLSNTGSQLPEADPGRLFDNLVSLRGPGSQEPHLGLGLYLVRLIALHHGGQVSAANQEDGVSFSLQIPRR